MPGVRRIDAPQRSWRMLSSCLTRGASMPLLGFERHRRALMRSHQLAGSAGYPGPAGVPAFAAQPIASRHCTTSRRARNGQRPVAPRIGDAPDRYCSMAADLSRGCVFRSDPEPRTEHPRDDRTARLFRPPTQSQADHVPPFRSENVGVRSQTLGNRMCQIVLLQQWKEAGNHL